MVFVPTPSQQVILSPRARELSRRLQETVDQFQRDFPDARPRDLEQALRAELLRRTRAPAVAIVVAAVAAALGLGVALYVGSATPGARGAQPTWVVAGIVVGLGVLVLARLVRRNE